jgi:hypothetical protein
MLDVGSLKELGVLADLINSFTGQLHHRLDSPLGLGIAEFSPFFLVKVLEIRCERLKRLTDNILVFLDLSWIGPFGPLFFFLHRGRPNGKDCRPLLGL